MPSSTPSPDTASTARSLADRMVRGGVVNVAGAVVTRLAGAATVIVLARHYDVESFAAFTFGIAFATFFSTVSDLGLDTVVLRELAAADGQDRDEILGSGMAAKALAIAATAAVGAGVALLYEGDLRVAGLVGTTTVLQALASTYGLTMVADLDMRLPTVVKTIGLVLTSGATVVVALGGADPILALGVYAGTGFLPGIALFAIVGRRRSLSPRLAWPRVWRLFREAVPVASATLAVVVFARIDQLLLGALGSDQDLATYGVVVRVVDFTNIALIAVSAVVLPAVSSLHNTDQVRIRTISLRANRYLAAVTFPAAAVATAVGGPALRTVFGADFADSGAVLAVLLWAHGFAFVFVVSRQILVGTGRSGELARLAWMAATANVVLNVMLIPTHGALGAAVASLVSYASPVALMVLRRDRHHPFVLAARAISRPVVAALAVTVATAAAGLVLTWVATAAVGVALVPVCLVLTRSIRRDDVTQLTVALRRGPSA